MKFYQYMYYSFLGLTLFLSHLLCIVVAYQYCLIEHHKTTSFPPYVAFFSAIPFLIGIIVCLIIQQINATFSSMFPLFSKSR